MSLSAALTRLKLDRELWVERLEELVRIPSCSFPGFDPQFIQQSAESIVAMLESTGFADVRILKYGGSAPAVLAKVKSHDPNAPTILLYAHHDVQPPMRSELWETPPFEPIHLEGRLHGRGAADDKAGVIVNMAAVAAWLQSSGQCPVNIIFLAEGEEEVGSPHLDDFLTYYKEELQADVIIVSDMINIKTGIPTITTSLRGMVDVRITLSSTKAPLHSGLWSGPLFDPVMEMSRLLASMVDDKGNVTIDGLGEGREPSEWERQQLRSLPLSKAQFLEEANALKGVGLRCEENDIAETLFRKSALTVSSFEGGAGKDAGNVLMDQAKVRLSIRLAPGICVQTAMKALITHIESHVPAGILLDLKPGSLANAWMADPNSPAVALAAEAFSRGYGENTVLMGCGATIPFVDSLSRATGGAPALLIGVEDPHSLAHSENESVDLNDLYKSAKALIHFFDMIANTN